MKNNCYVKTEKNKAAEEHKQLADFIKKVHINLYNESKLRGIDDTWKLHMQNSGILEQYAKTMYQLATKYWGKYQPEENKKLCRILWTIKECKEYFFNCGIQKYENKEQFLINKYKKNDNSKELINTNKNSGRHKTIKLLDVGSCYNPFKIEPSFDVTAIDIAPYSTDVHKCDFLNVRIDNMNTVLKEDNMIQGLPESFFDAVIFSLFLEYIPCPQKRFSCCETAYKVLKASGILIIITPDSKHQNANSKIFNASWKASLAKIGFIRIKYDKLKHLHCMIFRKCYHKETAIESINWKKILKNNIHNSFEIFIPRDFQNANDDSLIVHSTSRDNNEIREAFLELPNQ